MFDDLKHTQWKETKKKIHILSLEEKRTLKL